MLKIGVVIVTYNRCEKLQKALVAYGRQSREATEILVVNNHSTDDTAAILADWAADPCAQKRMVLSLSENIGGSGGFYEGLKHMQEEPVDWIFIADDDAYPEPDCLEKLTDYIMRADDSHLAAVCTKVETAGRPDTWHRRQLVRRFPLILEKRIPAERYGTEKKAAEPFSVDLFSYVGVMIRAEILRRTGLPLRDFFISYDDSEHALRVREQGTIVCVPSAAVNHDTADMEADDGIKVSWKKYYAVRNKLYAYRKHFPQTSAWALAFHYWRKFRRQPELRPMVQKAIRDGFSGRLGVDEIYQPGWKPGEAS